MRAVCRKCIVRSHSKIFIGHFFTSFPMMLQIRHFFTDFTVSLFPNAKLISLSLFFRDLLQAQQSLDKTFLARRLNCFPRDYLNDSVESLRAHSSTPNFASSTLSAKPSFSALCTDAIFSTSTYSTILPFSAPSLIEFHDFTFLCVVCWFLSSIFVALHPLLISQFAFSALSAL